MDAQATVALLTTFLGGFVMTWLRGTAWFNEGMTWVVAIAGGIWATWLIGAATPVDWSLGIMMHTLTVFGGVHVGGNLAKARAATDIPAAVMPQFSELSK